MEVQQGGGAHGLLGDFDRAGWGARNRWRTDAEARPEPAVRKHGGDREHRRIAEDGRRERGHLRGAEDGRAGRGLAGVLQGYRGAYFRDHADGSRGGVRQHAIRAVPWLPFPLTFYLNRPILHLECLLETKPNSCKARSTCWCCARCSPGPPTDTPSPGSSNAAPRTCCRWSRARSTRRFTGWSSAAGFPPKRVRPRTIAAPSSTASPPKAAGRLS